MRYRDLIQFDPIEDSIRLTDAADQDAARRLTTSYLLSPEMAAQLSGTIFPNLQLDKPGKNKAVLVIGHHGVGKTHLLAVISALAEQADLAADFIMKGCADATAIAGRFKVLRVEIGAAPKQKPLREILLGRIREYLMASAPTLSGMMAEFEQKFPEHGLLVMVDDLFDFLQGRKERELVHDVSFLRDLAEAVKSSRFRFMAGLQETAFDNPDYIFLAESLSHVREGFEQVLIGGKDVQFVARERLVRKTPEQRAWVEDHLRQWTRFYNGMSERLDEFVAMFPIHYDYIEVVRKIGFTNRWETLQTLSAALKNRLDEAVPEDEPGLIAFDSYWERLRDDPVCLASPEIEVVVDTGKRVEATLEKSFAPAEHKAMARRLVRGLFVQRLTTGDIYSEIGFTTAELRDKLCVCLPGINATAEALLNMVGTVLEEIRKAVGKHSVAFVIYTDQHYLVLKRFRRFVPAEVLLHWVNAVPFLLLMMTGATMLGAHFFRVEPGLLEMVKLVHKISAVTWLLALPPTVLCRFKVHWTHLRVVLRWGIEDLLWMVQSGRSLYFPKATVPASGRFNAGQKMNACLVLVYFFGFGTTGLLMLFKESILFPWYIHTSLFFAAMGSVGGHMYLAMVNPSTRIALKGIFHGWAPIEYIEHHHPLSLPSSLRAHMKPVTPKMIMEEVFVSKVEFVILAIIVIMSVAGCFVFKEAQLSAVKRNFSKSFAACIVPSSLSTKHSIGPTSESCVKCHLYAGQIPDKNCEACHANIKERRAQTIGYHGTLKGNCRDCHREHLDQLKSIIPMRPKHFDHNRAAFKLAGKHTKLECDECHKKKRTTETPGIYYIGLKSGSCTDCHRDQHDGQFAAACTKCHTPNGWTGRELKFVHDTDTSFKLVGKHKTMDCVKCHKPATPGGALGTAVFKGLKKDCTACHEEPHRKQFTAACTTCHSPSSWKKETLAFEHNRDAKFQLVGKHTEAACEKCHIPRTPGERLGFAQFRGLKTECADCHKDPHRGQFDRNCTKCHVTTVSWSIKNLRFEHNKDTKFTLSGKHASVDCIKCHKPQPHGGPLASATFKGLGSSCENCHKVNHPESYGSNCLICHTLKGWPKKVNPDHVSKHEFSGQHLLGKHLSAKCSACHNPNRISTVGGPEKTARECYTCHKVDDPHKQTLGTNCSKCHDTVGWKGDDLLFKHNTMTKFVMDQDHKKLACAKCHKDNQWKLADASCGSCHPKIAGGRKTSSDSQISPNR
jgi:cytochrome b subunit of formate dehydrogenase